ncbi:ATP-binding cassette domain-containing protein [Arcanobacterium phocae]|uniref:ATP-binding cassette domain-containing protein n=1 Tax=Arcanobacterium phocae TaxID=131112 RepID=UPI00344F1EC9
MTDVSLTVEQGDFMSIVGASGSGKSTLLKLCSDLIGPTSGELIYEGKSYQSYNPVELRKNIGYCFQTPHLFGEKVGKCRIPMCDPGRGIRPESARVAICSI